MVKVRRGYRSRNVGYRGAAKGGGGFRVPQSRGGKMGAGVGGAGLIGSIIAVVMALISGGGGSIGQVGLSPTGSTEGETVGAAPEQSDFYEATFDDIQNTWIRIFDGAGQDYPETGLIIFEDLVDTGGCGQAPDAAGRFYCPADQKAYLDPDFFDELGSRFGAPGDFAVAYVIAHEVGHHVQNVTGVSSEVRQRQ